MTYFLIAWRNLIKQPKKTIILLLAIGVGLFSLIFFQALTDGFYARMIENAVNENLGHIQINHGEFRLRKDPRYLIEDPESLEKSIVNIPGVEACSPRIICQGLISSPETSGFASINGIDPERESRVTITSSSIIKGSGLSMDDEEGVVIGKAMAEKLKVEPGDKTVIMLRGLSGEMEGAALRVRGIYGGSNREFQKANVYISIKKARKMLGTESGANQIAVKVDDARHVDDIAGVIQSRVKNPLLKVETWAQLEPILKQQVDFSSSYFVILYAIMFTALAFGIVNSFLMEVFDRIKEFGIMMSLGTKPVYIFATILMESTLLGLLGTALGSALSFIVLFGILRGELDFSAFADGLEYFGFSSIVPLELTLKTYLQCTLGTLITVIAAAVYPAAAAASFKPMEAVHHV